MTGRLSRTTIDSVKATGPALEADGLQIARRVYEHLFEDAHIRDLFNQSHHVANGSRRRALAGVILAHARNIERLQAMTPAVERIVQKHSGLQILPEHYRYVPTWPMP